MYVLRRLLCLRCEIDVETDGFSSGFLFLPRMQRSPRSEIVSKLTNSTRDRPRLRFHQVGYLNATIEQTRLTDYKHQIRQMLRFCYVKRLWAYVTIASGTIFRVRDGMIDWYCDVEGIRKETPSRNHGRGNSLTQLRTKFTILQAPRRRRMNTKRYSSRTTHIVHRYFVQAMYVVRTA